MTTSSAKNYNINTLRGLTNDDDIDVCETLGLPQEVAYSPQMIKAQIDRDIPMGTYKDTTRNLIKGHLSHDEMKWLDKNVVGKQ